MGEVNRRGGGTDASAPITWAMERRVEVDGFVIVTDCETWAGSEHPYQALKRYRDLMKIPAKLVVMSLCGHDRTFADPDDPLSMDVVGFDASAPKVVTDFLRGEAAPVTAAEEGEDDEG
jgi:60 kDa SS-A/Ro ribonucleoprotein